MDFRIHFGTNKVWSIKVFFLLREILFLLFNKEVRGQTQTRGAAPQELVVAQCFAQGLFSMMNGNLTSCHKGSFCNQRAVFKNNHLSLFLFLGGEELLPEESHFLCHHICSFNPELLADI